MCMVFNNLTIDLETSSGKFVEFGERYSFSGRKTGKLDIRCKPNSEVDFLNAINCACSVLKMTNKYK